MLLLVEKTESKKLQSVLGFHPLWPKAVSLTVAYYEWHWKKSAVSTIEFDVWFFHDHSQLSNPAEQKQNIFFVDVLTLLFRFGWSFSAPN